MIGALPKSLTVNNREYPINSDYRSCLAIMVAFNDPTLTDFEKQKVMLEILYEEEPEDLQEAIYQALWFLDCGKQPEQDSTTPQKVMDWEQDEQIIFSAINKVAHTSVRSIPYLHWWDFIGYYSEVGESTFATFVSIRNKKNKGEKLEKYELEFYEENKSMIDLACRYTEEEQAQIDKWNRILNGEGGE